VIAQKGGRIHRDSHVGCVLATAREAKDLDRLDPVAHQDFGELLEEVVGGGRLSIPDGVKIGVRAANNKPTIFRGFLRKTKKFLKIRCKLSFVVPSWAAMLFSAQIEVFKVD
jgi:hypothetical protein